MEVSHPVVNHSS